MKHLSRAGVICQPSGHDEVEVEAVAVREAGRMKKKKKKTRRMAAAMAADPCLPLRPCPSFLDDEQRKGNGVEEGGSGGVVGWGLPPLMQMGYRPNILHCKLLV